MNAPDSGGRPRLRILTGCTAVGKTAAALQWAEANGAEILSCDSLLFYRGMDIGTAKPRAADRARVVHHLIDILPPSEPMDVVQYASLAAGVAEAIAARGRIVLVVGGSGFYLQSFLRPVADDVVVPPEVRREVQELIETEGLAAAVRALEPFNPEGMGRLDVANPRRVARALERCRASGESLARLARRFAERSRPYAAWEVELAEVVLEPDELERRIAVRSRQMVEEGLLDEVRRLRSEGFERNPSAARAIGYRESLAVLDGGLAEAKLAEAIAASTRGLVKKQRTWFRTQLPEHSRLSPYGLRFTL